MGIDKGKFLYLWKFVLRYRYKKVQYLYLFFFDGGGRGLEATKLFFDIRPGNQLGRKKTGIDMVFLYLYITGRPLLNYILELHFLIYLLKLQFHSPPLSESAICGHIARSCPDKKSFFWAW